MSPLLKKKNGSTSEKYLLRKYCFLSAVFAFAVMLVFYIFHSNTLVFGERTVLRMDLYHQYGPLYAEVYDRITGGDSLIYSWTSGLGGSFLGNFFNYCCSPFVVFMLICGHENMPEAIALMIMFKAVLASTTFTYYINKSNKSVRKESIAFGLLYAFCAYFVAYSWNIMWMDAMAIFPLVILGIEKIIQENKPALYIFAMTYTMITNYYMAYMVCILSVMYFLAFFFGRYEISSYLRKGKIKNAAETEPENLPEITVSEKYAGTADENAAEPGENEFVEFNDTLSENEVIIPAENLTEAETEDIAAEAEAEENPAVSVSAGHISAEEKTEDIAAAAVTQENPAEQISADTGKTKKKKERKKKTPEQKLGNNRFWVTGWTFALASILCFLLAAFALMPVSFCLNSSSATGGTFPEKTKVYFDIFNFIANHLPSVETTIRSSGDNVIPNVYCGLITVFLIPFYFLSDKIPGKQKVVSAVLLMALYCGFALNIFNFIWHGLHMPNDLPYRFSFAYSFFLIIIAYKAFIHIGDFSNKAYIGAGFAMLALVVLTDKFKVPNCQEVAILLAVIFTVLYVVILGMLNSPTYKRDAIIGLLMFTIILELVVSDTPKLVMSQPKDPYVSDYGAYQEIRESAEDGEEELFYRTELSKLRTRMDACWYGYNGVSTFSSMAYEHVAKLMEKVGLFGNNINSYTYYPQTPVFNSMFSLKYIYDNENLLNSDVIYTPLTSNSDFEAYEYNYFLPLAFSVDSGIKEWDTGSKNPFEVQNKFISSATGIEDVLVPVDASSVDEENLKSFTTSDVNSGSTFSVSKDNKSSEGKAIVKIKVEEEGEYFVYAGSTRISCLTLEAQDFYYSYPSSSIQPLTMDLGYLPADSEITVTCTVPKDKDSATITFCAARLDMDKFTEAYNKIKSNGTIALESFDETNFKGTVNVTNSDAFLYTSVPYDESWKVYVDGAELAYPDKNDEGEIIEGTGNISKVGGALIGFDVSEGEHEIEFIYKAAGLSDGMILTAAGLIILILLLLYKFVFSSKFEKKHRPPMVLRKPDYFID